MEQLNSKLYEKYKNLKKRKLFEEEWDQKRDAEIRNYQLDLEGHLYVNLNWADKVEWHQGNLLVPDSLKDVMNGVTAVISDSPLILRRSRNAHLRILRSDEKRVYVTEASKEPFGLSQDIIDSEQRLAKRDSVADPFKELEYRFLDFKRRNYVENLVNYQNLSRQQAPKTLGSVLPVFWGFNLEKHLRFGM